MDGLEVAPKWGAYNRHAIGTPITVDLADLRVGTDLASVLASSPAPQRDDAADFAALNASPRWQQKFADAGTSDWQEKWFLDGDLAKVKSTPLGLQLSAGPKDRDDAHHAVLWTQATFAGDVKMEFTYTRTDTARRNVNILYLQATGVGEPPYATDIATWRELRRVPAMRTYFANMNLLHISFAAFDNHGPISDSDYVRARRYPISDTVAWPETEVPPSYDDTGLFQPGVTYHITAIKTNQRLYFQVQGPDSARLFSWDVSDRPPLLSGRIGLRHMHTRSARYADISISTAPAASP